MNHQARSHLPEHRISTLQLLGHVSPSTKSCSGDFETGVGDLLGRPSYPGQRDQSCDKHDGQMAEHEAGPCTANMTFGSVKIKMASLSVIERKKTELNTKEGTPL